MTVIGYIRVSKDEQEISLEAQRNAIEADALRRGWNPEYLIDHGFSGGSLKRPAITEALERLERGEAKTLIVAKLDRLSRSVADFAALMEKAQSQGWSLIALDIGVDMTTPAGQLIANVMAAVAQWERTVISQRTKDALAALKAKGVRLGGPSEMDPEVRDRIVAMRTGPARMTLTAIAGTLNAEGVPTARGGAKWWPSTIAAVLKSVELDRAAESARRAG